MQANDTPLKLLPKTGVVEEIDMDILGDLTPTPLGNNFLLVIVDRFTQLVKTVLL